MAELTDKGKASLETLRDYWPERKHYSSILMKRKFLLQKVEENPEFLVEQHSILRPDWNRLKDHGLIVDTTTEPVYVVEGTDKVLYRGEEKFVKITRPSDSNFRQGQIVSKREFSEMVEVVEEQGGEIPLGESLKD